MEHMNMAVLHKSVALRYLANVPDDARFVCHDGRVLHRMAELADALETMSEATFAYHTPDGNNHFSNWVRDIVGDEKLAKDLKVLPGRKQCADRVQRRLVFLRHKVNPS